jgi:hypothetical protein
MIFRSQVSAVSLTRYPIVLSPESRSSPGGTWADGRIRRDAGVEDLERKNLPADVRSLSPQSGIEKFFNRSRDRPPHLLALARLQHAV